MLELPSCHALCVLLSLSFEDFSKIGKGQVAYLKLCKGAIPVDLEMRGKGLGVECLADQKLMMLMFRN